MLAQHLREVVQADEIGIREGEVEVLERLRKVVAGSVIVSFHFDFKT